MVAWMWFAVAGLCLLTEILTTALLFASFALAALAAGITNYLLGDSYAQWIVLAATAILSLTVLRPIATKFIFKKTPQNDTGVVALIGKNAITLEQITPEGGRIRLSGEVWTAHCESGSIESGANVTVLRIEGAVAMVAASR